MHLHLMHVLTGGFLMLRLQHNVYMFGPAHLKLVCNHVPQPLVVHRADEDVCSKLLPSDSADHGLTCACTGLLMTFCSKY